MRAGTLIAGLGLAALAACAAWAFRPLHHNLPLAARETELAAATEPSPAPPLDLAAFRVPLWVAPPAPPPAPAAAPPPPPLRLQLIAIARDNGMLRASVYDADTDTILVVAAGDRIVGRLVERVTEADIAFLDRGQSRALSLRGSP